MFDAFIYFNNVRPPVYRFVYLASVLIFNFGNFYELKPRKKYTYIYIYLFTKMMQNLIIKSPNK